MAKTVVVESPDQQNRISMITDVLYGRHKSYNVFMASLKHMSLAERKATRFGTIQVLWQEFPQRMDLDGKVGNGFDPGDGLIYTHKEVTQATLVLKAFYEAWCETAINANFPKSSTLPKPGRMTSMVKICMILRGMNRETLLDYFCEHEKSDQDLPFRQTEAIERILPHENAYDAATFMTEQYRAVCRTWNDGEHIEIDVAEPLPLILQHEYRTGSYGSVQRHEHAFTEAIYARKEQISDDAQAHLEREIAGLKKVQHRHIVQFVKSYRRGNRYGILLKPAATTDLERLLERYRANGLEYQRNQHGRRDRVVYRPIILRAFGCLSLALSHIHGRKIRHKDIKPSNILYEKEYEKQPAKFLWADFGLAYDFGTKRNSKTRSRSRYSPRYAAPEIIGAKKKARAKTLGTLQSAQNSDEEAYMTPDCDDDIETPQDIDPGHGRSSDIFSFGCVFLEILGILMDEKPPSSDEDGFEYRWSIKDLQAWTERKADGLQPDDQDLKPLLELGSRMIRQDPDTRPVIDKIVWDLAGAGKGYFCAACLGEAAQMKHEHEHEDTLKRGHKDLEINELQSRHRQNTRHHEGAATDTQRAEVSTSRHLLENDYMMKSSGQPRSPLRSSGSGSSKRGNSPRDARMRKNSD